MDQMANSKMIGQKSGNICFKGLSCFSRRATTNLFKWWFERTSSSIPDKTFHSLNCEFQGVFGLRNGESIEKATGNRDVHPNLQHPPVYLVGG
jgi:hypothetical protein